MSKVIEISAAVDVTDEILTIVYSIVDGWYSDSNIDLEDLLDRLEKHKLSDGSSLDLGDSFLSPAIKKIQRCAQQHKRES